MTITNMVNLDAFEVAVKAAKLDYLLSIPGNREVMLKLFATYEAAKQEQGDDDICGFCGQPGADKIPHPVRWPGEGHPGSEYVHAECEQEECRRAHANLTDQQRRDFLRHV